MYKQRITPWQAVGLGVAIGLVLNLAVIVWALTGH